LLVNKHQYSFFMANSQPQYHLHLKGYVGGYDFDSDYVDYILAKYPDSEVKVIICSQGGSLTTALSCREQNQTCFSLAESYGKSAKPKVFAGKYHPQHIFSVRCDI